MKQDANQIIEQALLQAFREEQSAYPQEEPVLSPGFRERMMELNRQYLQQGRRHKTQFRRWACAAAAAIIIGTVGMTGAYRWIQHQNRPETVYTISHLPENCTQAFHQSTPHMSHTMWKADGGNIVLMQEENSLISLMENQSQVYCMIKEVHTDTLDGRLYINIKDRRMILVWQNGKYFFLLTMDGVLNQEEQLIRTASNLKVV